MVNKPPTVHEVEARNVEDATGLVIEKLGHKRTPWEQRLIQTWGSGTKGVWTHAMGICKGCGAETDTTPTVMRWDGNEIEIPSTVCEPCMELVRAHYDPNSRPVEEPTATPKWDANCPERYKQVVIGGVRPANVDWTAHDKVIAWRPDLPRGMVLVGAPGTGKTCAYWHLARELELSSAQPITIGSLELARTLSQAALDIRDVGWLYRCRVLMVDDLGKERATPAVAALLWEVLDRRLSANLPVILTTNFVGKDFEKRFGEEHLGASIRRRIAELCRVVQFGAVYNAKAA